MATDLDFIEALSDSHLRKEAAGEFMKKLVGAGKGLAGLGVKVVKENKLPIGAALLGAGAAGTGAYLLAKPGKNGEPSADQKMTQKLVEESEKAKKEEEAGGKKAPFRKELTRAMLPASKNVSDVMAKHPGKAALLAAPFGATAALRALRLFTK